MVDTKVPLSSICHNYNLYKLFILANLRTSPALHCHLPFFAVPLTFSALMRPSVMSFISLDMPPTILADVRCPNVSRFITR